VIEFVRHGLALAMLPASLVGRSDELRLIPIRGRAPEFLIAVATPSNRRLTTAARALMDKITTNTGG
jgi:DNA-binding transcriptional LysR family regulator